MATRTLNGVPLAIGLKWLEPGAISSKSRASKISRRLLTEKPTPAGYAALETPAGTQPGVTTFASDIGLPTAAGWLAAAQTSAVLIEPLEENLIWLCIIEQGAVFPSGDLIGNRDVIETRLEELLYDISDSDMPFYDNAGMFKDRLDAQALSFSDLVAGTESSQASACHPVRKRSLKKTLVSSTAVVVLVCFAYGGWTIYKSQGDAGSAQQAHSTESRLAEQRNDEIAELRDSLSQDAGALIAFFADRVYDRPLRAGGWRTVSYQWRDDKVTVIWERDVGNIASIAKHLKGRTWSMDESSGIVTEEFDFPAPRLQQQPIELTLPGAESRYGFLDILAVTPGLWTLGASTETGTHFKARKSKLQGASVHLASAITAATYLRRQPVRINSLKAQVDKRLSWIIEGEYYEKAR